MSNDALAELDPDTLLDLIRAEQEIRSLRDFVRSAWHVHHGDVPLEYSWHIDALCDHLEAVLPGRQIKNLLINIPPGFLKSLLVSVYWPAWLWLREPGLQICAASASHMIALRDAKRQHDICGSDWYRDRYGVTWRFDRQQDAKGYYVNTAGGFRVSCSSGQRVIGSRGSLNLADDLLDAQHAYPDRKELRGHVQWYQESWRTRVNSEMTTPLVVIMQRLHEIDLSGVLLREDGWEYLCLPNEYVPRKTWTVLGRYDPREEAGELLHPARLDRDRTEAKKSEMGHRAYSAQYQQDPIPAGGAMIQAEWLHEYTPDAIPAWTETESPPEEWDYTIHSWDTAEAKEKWAAYSVGQVWGVRGPRRYLIDQVRARMAIPDLLYAIRELQRRYPGARATLIERQSSGRQVTEMLQREIPGLIARSPDRAKEARLAACLPQYEAGNVWIPALGTRPWVEEYIRELLAFPASTHQDQVDATTQALNWIHEHGRIVRPWVAVL